MNKFRISIQDLNYCFNQLQHINPIDKDGKYLDEISVLCPRKMSRELEEKLRSEGLELQCLLIFERILREDGHLVFKVKTPIEVVTQY